MTLRSWYPTQLPEERSTTHRMTPTPPCTCHAGQAAKSREYPARQSNHARHQNASLRTSVQPVPVTAAVIQAHQVEPPSHAHELDQPTVPAQGSEHTHATLSWAQQMSASTSPSLVSTVSCDREPRKDWWEPIKCGFSAADARACSWIAAESILALVTSKW